MRYSGAAFDGADMTEATASGCDLRRATFRGTNLTGADLSHADLEGADFEGATCDAANFEGSNVTHEQLRRCRSLARAILPDGSVHETVPLGKAAPPVARIPSDAARDRTAQGGVIEPLDETIRVLMIFVRWLCLPMCVLLATFLALAAASAWREGEWPRFLGLCLVMSSGGLCAAGAVALRGWEDRRRNERARAEAEEAYGRLAGRIIELYGNGASTGTAGAEAVTLFLEAEEDLERDPQGASSKIRRAAAKLDEVDERRARQALDASDGST